MIDLKLWVHVLLMDQILCRDRCQQRCQSEDVTVADVLRVSVIYIGYYMLFGHSNWWIVTCVWRFGLFVLINITIDRYYCSLLFILRRNWRTLCTWSSIHCAGAQFTHDKTVDIHLINTSTHPYPSRPYYAITAFRWNSLKNIYRDDELSHSSTKISAEACLPAVDPLYFGGRRVATAVEP